MEELLPEAEKEVSKALKPKQDTLFLEVSGVVWAIRKKDDSMKFYKISRACGWSDSRVSQILRFWKNPKYVSENSKQKILTKLRECLESVNRKKDEVEE